MTEPRLILPLNKSFVKGHFRNGKWVQSYTNKVVKGPEEPPHPKQPSLFGKFFSQAPSYAPGMEGFAVPKPKPKPKAWHPKADPDGKATPIWKTTDPTGEETWTDPVMVATFVPGGSVPAKLNGIAFAPWSDHPQTEEGWDYVDGQMDDLDEPPLKTVNGKPPASGVVIEESDGRVWIVHPTNQFAGYEATFPKGHAEPGLSLQANAIKEAFEESGLKVEITGLIGDVERTGTVTRYYRAKRVGGSPVEMGWESQAVSLVPKDEVGDLVNSSPDKKLSTMAGFGKVHEVEDMSDWEMVGDQEGSNPGGFFEDTKGTLWYCKFTKTPDHASNEVLTAKLYEAAGVRVPELKLIADSGHIGVASRVWKGVKKNAGAIMSGKVPGVYSGFAADCWLADWDSVGLVYDNLLVAPDGKAVRIDVGGSLLYRAQGAPKGDAFGDKVTETETLRSPKNYQAYTVFKDIPHSAIVKGVERIAKISDNEIRTMVEQYGPGGSGARKRLAERLIARKNDLIERYL